jgi:N-acetylmuramoyl-L-alanine amidase
MTAIKTRLTPIVALSAALVLAPLAASAQTAVVRYTDAQERDEQLRSVLASEPVVRSKVADEARAVMVAYDALVRRYPLSGYSDNALFNAADLATLLYDRFGDPKDRDAAVRLYQRLIAEYPASSLIKRAQPVVVRLENQPAAPAGPTPAATAPPGTPTESRARLTAIDRVVLPEAVRITLSLDREVPYHEETLNGPSRVFFDFKGAEAAPELVDAVLRYPAQAVRQIRVGRHPNSTVRVVLDLDGVGRHTVYPLYNPFRIVIDCEPLVRAAVKSEASVPVALTKPAPAVTPPIATASPAPTSPAPLPPPSPAPSASPPPKPRPTVLAEPQIVLPARPTTPPDAAAPPPEPPNANRAGGFSIARQLGLGVSRIVIDPGHGGHDPGAQVKGLDEADLTLDIAVRLEELLQKEPGLQVVLTRRENVYVPLEERTAIANREEADLFLSIHANASRNPSARGVETYFLSFASSPDAEAVAARENSASAAEMRQLPDIIRAIALNNKLDESRDLAGMVQEALISRLQRSNRNVRNLGVKKAPFVVLIGAAMPSVLAEVSFLTNRQELVLLKNPAYKQRIAEALHAAVMRYRRSLKGQAVIASK